MIPVGVHRKHNVSDIENDKFVIFTGFELVGQNLTFIKDSVWNIAATPYSNAVNDVINIPYAPTGYKRIDIFVGTTDNNFIRVPGTLSLAANPVSPPATPPNTVYATFVTVTDNAISQPTPVIVDGLYRKKVEKGAVLVSADSGSSILVIDQKSSYKLNGTMPFITHLFNYTNPNSSPLYDGREHTIICNQEAGVTLKHNSTLYPGNALAMRFWFKNEQDLFLSKGDIAVIKWIAQANRHELVSLNGTAVPLSIQNENGFEQFIAGNTLKFKGVSFDPANKIVRVDPLVPLSAFLDPINGSDINGVLENANRPFKTLNALLTALPTTTGETYTIHITGGIIAVTRRIVMRNLKFISYGSCTLDFTNCMEADGFTHAQECLISLGINVTWVFDNQNISIICNYVGRKELAINNTSDANRRGIIFIGYLYKLDWRSTGFITFGSSAGLPTMAGTLVTINELYDSTQTRSNLCPIGDSKITINNFIASGRNNIFTYSPNSILEVKNITEAVINAYPLNVYGGKVKIGNVTLTGVLRPNCSELEINGTLSAGCKIDYIGVPIIRGTVNSTLYGTTGFNNIPQKFDNFTGKLSKLLSAGTNSSFTFLNSNIETNDFLVEKFVDKQNILFFVGSNVLTQTDTTLNLVRNYATTPLVDPNVIIDVKGSLSTNIQSLGSNATTVYGTSTFKEKLNEIVIRSKKDLVNKVLSSELNYILDGIIEILPTESIIVPLGGLSLSGYGFDVSAIKAKTAGSTIFTSPVGGCGNLFIQNLSIEASGGGSKVFNLTNAGAPTGGADAIELNVVNFDNCDSLGELTKFRQGLWDNIGIFSVKDGLTLSGTWSGGFRSDLVIVRNFGIAGTTSILFKKGTDLLFKSRFLTDVNADFKTGGLLSNFTTDNFYTSKLFQIKAAQVSRGGVLDSTDNFTDTITVNDSVTDWFGNNGLPNAGQKAETDIVVTASDKGFVLTAPDGTKYRMTVDNAGVTTMTAIL